MLKTFHVNYKTEYGDAVLIQMRENADSPLVSSEMQSDADGNCEFKTEKQDFFQYRYAVRMRDGLIEERHWRFSPKAKSDVDVYDTWRSPESGSDALAAPAFSSAVFRPESDAIPESPKKGSLVVVLIEPRVGKDEEIRVVAKQFISWNAQQAIKMQRCRDFTWIWDMGSLPIMKEVEFKFCIWDTKNDCFKRYEDGMNRYISVKPGKTQVYTYNGFNYGDMWRAAGVAVPVFSLRSHKGRGCGEFLDLKPLADWCEQAHLRVIQLLPINDTTAERKWRDSYPYNAISIMALHPSYISVDDVYDYYGKRMSSIERETGLYLNDTVGLDYNRTRDWKNKNLRSLFDSVINEFANSELTKEYLAANASWINSYAAFATLRDRYGTPNFHEWPALSKYDAKAVEAMFAPGSADYANVMYRVFLQFHLERQLRDAIDYVHKKGIAIKGDLPIGINPNSVDAWTEPELFDFGLQAGAPPDFFSRDGQNWGFPTYRWDVMARDGYSWWERRMQRMQMFFDAFRIDHILGFFRIWSIPFPFRSGLMGVFSPSLPLSEQELKERGVMTPAADLAWPSVTEEFLRAQFQEYTESAKQFFNYRAGIHYLKEGYFDPSKFDNWIEKEVEQNARERMRNGVDNVLHEVLLISVKEGEWQPRIMMEETDRFRRLGHDEREAMRAIYNDFFFSRHNDFWKKCAEERLNAMLGKCGMLVCGEDLGMIPASVPVVMQRTQILSLELQRMPKESWQRFGTPSYYPYLSVCATSSHDISPIRGWWEEDRKDVQWYYNNIMHRGGEAPKIANEDIVTDIISQNLYSPSMLCINPIQDYAGMLDDIPHLLPFEERINVPSNLQQHWCYRIPFCVDDLTTVFSRLGRKVAQYVDASGRK